MVSEFLDSYRNRHQIAEGLKGAGKQVFGYFCNYTPEELIYSAGIVPVRIRGSAENVTLADTYLPSFCCSYIRSALDQGLRGKYNYLDGVVFPKTCDMTRAVSSIWKRNIDLPYYWFLPVPGKSTKEAVEFFTQELRIFKESLEGFTNQEISDDSIKQAIKVYNENRSLVGEVYKLAIEDSHSLKGSDIFGILQAGRAVEQQGAPYDSRQ
jgi:benzoyl-CoA reductase subunit C